MDTTTYIKEQFEQLQSTDGSSTLSAKRQDAFAAFSNWGIPTTRHEEWKYTRIGGFFNKSFEIGAPKSINIDAYRLPGHEVANELVFVNGQYAADLSTIRSAELNVIALEEALKNEYADIANKHFNHSANYLKDGINALNTAFVTKGAVFIAVKRGKIVSHPVYIYNITDGQVLALPRTLVHLGENAQIQIVETFVNVGDVESFTNQVMEIVVERDAILEYYKIQNESAQASQVSTTHIRQVGKSLANAVTISLNGAIVRNNTNVVMEDAHCEAHLYGLYYPKGNTLIDNHTVVDNAQPNCYSNELYKGMLDENGTGVFNGKIFVRQPAQKTNAFQSNKNVLLSDTASVNTKPQLEIFADDVKCSHGCTVGKLDEEGLFYLQSRGVPERTAKAMLLHGFAGDVIEKIKIDVIREYVDQVVSERLGYEA
ncbi:MAG: Fe-S cluster assembly protein SufD [Citrobacter freundii]|nr:MAG: Fe-S cluster assembly protein SufD [Citrobacter freundii]